MDVWQLQRRIGSQLLVWAGFSVLAGAALWWTALPFARGLALQFFAWGLIDAAIAGAGRLVMERRRSRLAEPETPAVQLQERRSLRRLLRINAALDVLYLGIGVSLLLLLEGAFARGNASGVIVQGGFLLLFDGWHGWSRNVRG